MNKLIWTGPFLFRELLEGCLSDEQPWPPGSRGVYVVSQKKWKGAPGTACHPLYVGGNTGASPRFCTRIGDLIADLYGFFDSTGHHSGGQSLFGWCKSNAVHPGSLFIGWATRDPWCDRCAEVELVNQLARSWEDRRSLLNKKRPPACRVHDSAVR